jgi:hypothetical protein
MKRKLWSEDREAGDEMLTQSIEQGEILPQVLTSPA